MKRRRYFILALLVAILLPVTLFASGAKEAQDETGDIILRFYFPIGTAGDLTNIMNSLCEQYNAEHEGVIVEPIFAIIGLLLAYFIEPIMPWALAFAAGCMIYVTIEDLIPSATSGEGKNHYGIIAFMIGFILMFLLDFLLS